MIDTLLFIRLLNPKKMKYFKKYSLLGKNLRFGASINHQN